MNKDHLVVYCTCPDQGVAERIAAALVTERLAACVNILPGVVSVYRWQGQLQRDPELLLVVKTSGRAYPALEARIRQLHPYEVAEIIALPVLRGFPPYLDWIDACLETGP